MGAVHKSSEVALVRAAVKRSGSSAVARKLGVSEAAVRAWAAGERKPKGKSAEAILEKLGGIVSAAVVIGPPILPRRITDASDPPSPDSDDPRANAVATLRVLRAALEKADPCDVPSIANSITSSSRLLARLSGQIDVTESQVLRSAAWTKLRRIIGAVLAEYPGAIERLDAALEAEAAS
jgi:DNA-binding transcriptional regulator YdaS (Cro superfamily)